MDRLTRRTADGVELCFGEILVVSWPAQDAVTAALNRLAAYEDTGLTPERAAELAQAEVEANEPLTLEQLREMAREPVYIVLLNEHSSWWIVIRGVTKEKLTTDYGGWFALENYGKTWLAYRRKLKEVEK